MTASIAKRHQHILNKLREQGYVSVSDLSQELKVSTVTIRKDLKQLEERKLLFRSHGSATTNNPYINDRPVNEKEKIQVSQKQHIARCASGLIEPSDNIIMASGTTIIEMARHIKVVEPLTVITASLNVSLILSCDPLIEIIQLGGLVRKSSSSIIGHNAENMILNFSCNKLFLGADGIDLDYGITTTNDIEANLNKQMIKAAQKVIVLADSTKFGLRGFSRICELQDIDIVITDKDINATLLKRIEEAGIEIIIN